ncbi:MAG: zf-HC2 domain-containing protein, partial [Planctomycetota bacterium]|nr:zf-HC2 domain-containing protein [Planctomycetota bacterium]
MSCPFERDVLLLADGDLPFGRRMVVEAHLAVCPACAAIEETLDVIEHQLRNGPAAPLGVVEPVLARIAGPVAGTSRRLIVGACATAAAAAALVVVLWPSAELRREAPARKEAHAPEPRGVTLPPPTRPGPALAQR